MHGIDNTTLLRGPATHSMTFLYLKVWKRTSQVLMRRPTHALLFQRVEKKIHKSILFRKPAI